METETIKHKTGPVLKPAAEPRMPPPAPPAKQTVMQMDDPWHSMDTAPKDEGFHVFLRGDPSNEGEVPNEWYWYPTRQYRKGTWQVVGWWRRRFGPNAPPSFTPSGWVLCKEGLPK